MNNSAREKIDEEPAMDYEIEPEALNISDPHFARFSLGKPWRLTSIGRPVVVFRVSIQDRCCG
jgi:hypothetical protein